MSNAPIRTVLVGCGGICRAWLKAIENSTDVQIVGLVDINEANIAKVAEQFHFESLPRGTNLKDMLDTVRPDAVFDCTIPEAHFEVTTTALAHGCHVLGEKPLADSMAHARAMVAAARQAGKIYAVIQNRRYQNAIRSVRAFLDSGRIGKVSTVNSDFYIGAHFGGFRDRMAHVLLLDMAIHSFDQARLVSGANPLSVFCHEWNPHGSWYDHDASAQCIFEMTNDIVFNYRGSWCCEGLNTTWECDWRIIGDKGCLKWDGGDNCTAAVVTKTGGWRSETEEIAVPIVAPPGMEPGHKGVIMEFLNGVKNGGVPMTSCEDNIHSLAMVFGAIESADQGQRVKIAL